MRTRFIASTLVAFSFLIAPALKATPLLTADYEVQLEAWLGQGDLDFTKIYTKQAGDDATDFHTAIDGRGATFTLMSISGSGPFGTFALPQQVIGGYNPQSWSSISDWNITSNDSERTGFIYNLTFDILQRQNLIGEGSPDSGQYQTYNGLYNGPTFGGGHDLVASFDLSQGAANNYSYGGTSMGAEIFAGDPNFQQHFYFDVDALEVWTFTAAVSTVPDTEGAVGLLTVALIALHAFRRRVV